MHICTVEPELKTAQGTKNIGANCPGLSGTVPEKYTVSRVPDGGSFVPEFKGQLTKTNKMASNHSFDD